ncbi:MAG: radical SAM protein [Candidatus Omnitrophica bacterium]|nr:radical SAM protein [Candidatus Omnitrophota bacterium]
MRLALVFNPFKYKVHEENIKIVQKYFGQFPPLSMSWVASIAEQAGHKVIIVDARALELSKEATLDILKSFHPDVMGFMMTTYMFQDTLEWIRFLKSRLKVPVVVGGYNLRVYPRQSLSHPEIDFGVVEHAYYTLPALFREMERAVPDFDNVPGLVFKKNSDIVVTPHPQRIEFDKFPNPARHLLPNKLYAEFPTERKNFTVMVTSLGCPFECQFCEAGQTQYNPRSPQTVINEIEECYRRHGVREIDFFDYEFTGIRERVLEICRLIGERKIDIGWACRSRVDTVDWELLGAMKKSGCGRIYFGIESGNQELLDGMRKGIKLKQVMTTIDMCRQLKIKTLGFFLIGAPGDNKSSVKKTLQFAKRLGLDYVQFSKCLAKPLTPLWKQMVKTTGKDYWSDWVLGKETDKELPRPWTSLSNSDINKITKWAYINYHARPAHILKHILTLRSFSEFKRKFMAFFDMVFSQENEAKACVDFKAFNENPLNQILREKEHRP